MEEPFITIFTPNYNGEKFLSESIKSVLNQSYNNFEYILHQYILLNDGCPLGCMSSNSSNVFNYFYTLMLFFLSFGSLFVFFLNALVIIILFPVKKKKIILYNFIISALFLI